MPSPSPSPSMAASPSPSPSPTPVTGSVTWSLDGQNLYINQQTNGPGTTPPEGPGFANSSPLAPNTPYDTWSSAPQIPGTAGILQYRATPTYHGKDLYASVQLGAGFLTGSASNAMYWGENLLPTFNPHLGNQALPYRVIFPTTPNADYGQNFRFSVLNGSIGANDGSWSARAGYFDLTQSDRFIFIQPPFTSVTPALAVAPAESLGNGAPTLSWWPAPEPGLPLLGLDFTAHTGLASFELSNAALPALAGTSARATLGSAVIDHGEGTRYTAEVLHLWTGGSPIFSTALYGTGAMTVPGPQGELPVSTLSGQRATVAGFSASFHATKALDAELDVARQWYDSTDVDRPGSQKAGGYYHLSLARKINRVTATAEWFRFEPRYATPILPYGALENVWSAAWAWPGQWLKSNYQINDNTALGVNRQGYRFKYFVDGGPLEWHIQYAKYRQVDFATIENVTQAGFVDGFFLPQLDGFGTRGAQTQYAAWLAWHANFGNLSIDYVLDGEHRPAYAAHPEDLVDYVAPQVALTYSRQITPTTLVAVGYGRYAMRGTWATTPLDYGQSTWYGGGEFQETKALGLFVQYRHSSFDGLPSFIGGPSPDFAANLAIVEERIHF